MNELKHAAEFRSVLKNYTPSPAAKKILEEIKLVLLTAPTAGGRNTIIKELEATGNYRFVVSDTTRKPRVNNGVLEQNGREYWFRTEAELLDDLKNGAFLEAELIHGQQVSGISIRELEKAREQHEIAIDEVDMQGIANVLPTKPDTIGILIIPPNFEEWLRRVNSRGEMEPAERQRRFRSAAEIYAMARDGKYPVIINDNLKDSAHKVDQLARFGELVEDQDHARALAKQLHLATLEHLKELQ
jgi:guanylate kinase